MSAAADAPEPATEASTLPHLRLVEAPKVERDTKRVAERLIEVKTTRGGVSSPFFATRNEVEVSDAERTRYHLYRVFAFGRAPQLFTLRGSLRATCLLEPMQYRAEVA